MALTVIGAGFGRTGTLSLKGALEQLLGSRCYHMMEVIGNPTHAAGWHDAARKGEADWDALLDGYAAAVDWPACYFWRELRAHAPDAKLILTERDPQRWYESVTNTIYQVMARPVPDGVPELVAAQRAMAIEIILHRTFDDRFEDRDHAIAVYQRHNEAVKRDVPAEKLLVLEVAQGWEPLCEFLDVPVPANEFPRVNTTDEFVERFRMTRR